MLDSLRDAKSADFREFKRAEAVINGEIEQALRTLCYKTEIYMGLQAGETEIFEKERFS